MRNNKKTEDRTQKSTDKFPLNKGGYRGLLWNLEKYGKWSLSKNSVFVILRLDRGIQKALKTLDSRFRENDDFLWKCQFLDKLSVPGFV